jgi:glycosyltransferase involved in cell wall biosynthesis
MKLNLFFTEGVSLRTWDQVGMLEREVAIYKGLQARGVDVGFVSYGDRSEQEYSPRLPQVSIHSNKWKLPIHLYQKQLELFPPKGDVFKSNQVAGALVGLRAARKAGAKFVARCGYLLTVVQEQKHGQSSEEYKYARGLEKEMFIRADRSVVTTNAIAARVHAEYGIGKDKLRVIPNYVETERFSPKERAVNARPRIGFVGRLAVEKNLPALLHAVQDLDVELCLVGYGPKQAELQEQARGMKAMVSFLGSLPNADLPEFLNSCDLFVFPSLYEGHPKALIEAMAMKLPVIGTRVQGIQELLVDGETGLLCDTNADGIRDTVQRALADQALRTRLGQAARAYVEQHFALSRVLEMELALLQELAE